MVRRGYVVVILALAACSLAGCVTVKEPGMLDFYSTQSHWTDPGELAAMYDGLPDDVPGIVRAVQGVILHGAHVRLYGFEPSEAQQGGWNVRATEDLLRRIKALDGDPLSVARPPEKRLLVNCRQFAVLTCSILRHKGVPARARAGYARYTWGRGMLENHWICEYWLAAQERWVGVDAQMDAKQRDLMRIGFDTLDVPPGEFVSGGDGWRLYRAGKAEAERFGLGGKDGWNAMGWKMVMPNVVCDTMALNKAELLPWDVPPYWDKAEGNLSAQDVALIDKAADLAADLARNWAEFRALYEANPVLRMPPDWKDLLPEAPAQ